MRAHCGRARRGDDGAEDSSQPVRWFDGNAKEAVEDYLAVFPASNVVSTAHYPTSADEGLADFQKDMVGKELAIDFEPAGQRFTAMHAGPGVPFNEAVSFAISCEDQHEIDYYWERLSTWVAA